MNFFDAQDDARRRTRWLVVYFILAIVGVILSVYGIVFLAMLYTGGATSPWMPGVFTATAIGTGGVMGMGSLFKTMQLNGGGEVVARDMGARQVDPHTRDTDERRLVNVVEEMAIASGVPVPQIWIMDEELGINAFAAGTEPGNAVVAVTRGCIQRLSRSEIQGVVAHEFSHILNGDMRLNMRLMGLLFGILMISMIGRMMFEALRFVRVRSSSNDKGGGAGIVIAIVAVGVSLMIVGSIGVFFGRLIQAAISRQREYLADASAVQFTRDPDGIAGALKKIGGQQYGSKMNAAKATEASHLLFADGGMFSYGLATHPPLDVRIKALQKSWDGEFTPSEIPDVAAGRSVGGGDPRVSGFSGQTVSPPPISRHTIDQMGEPAEVDLQTGHMLRSGLKREWVHACHDREEAQALIFGLLLAEDNQLREGEIMFVKKGAGEDAGDLSLHWNSQLASLHSSEKIALVDLSIPTLRGLSLPEYDRFIEITQWLIASDGQVDLFEFMLQRVVQRHLDSHFRRHAFPKIKYRRIEALQHEVNVLVTTMAAVGGEDQMAGGYAAAMGESGWGIQMAPPSECGLANVESALEKFNWSTPLVKKQLLRMLGLAVMYDGIVESREAELLRATADAIGCSVPPFVKGE
ncbi:MAG: M48 family metallopeptidase [Verrucomicrobiae bacterium]|nr:M48 family metallopeptidase [Verrucomicrobiae bacterium]NNJ43822.1 M48 family metallopeptidase [Akkermansiaceae bacterium]